MKTYKFTVDVGYPGCEREVTVSFNDNVTEDELAEYAEELVWSYVSVEYNEIDE